MPKRGKGYKNVAEKVDRATLYDVPGAMAKVVETGHAKFDERCRRKTRRPAG